jgi:UDP-N-acetylmuramoyl-L-alanyl-D-glutamate--2,6-diaminopimelate ligase
VGRHNLINALQAATVAYVLADPDPGSLREALATCPAVPGRLEPVGPAWPAPTIAASDLLPTDEAAMPPTGPVVLVDYAHTHDALLNALSAVRPLVPEAGQLVVVFGCGGDRDRTKRPEMARVACQLADRVVITSDNPRTEEPGDIIDDILAGVPVDLRPHASATGSGRPAGVGGEVDSTVRLRVEPDRGAAIAGAIAEAGVSDVILIAGKGHEDYQIVGTDRHHFDDREQAAQALRQRAGQSSSQSGH